MSVSLSHQAILGGCNASYCSAFLYGRILAYCVGNGVVIYDLATEICNQSLVGHKDRVNIVKVLNEGTYLTGSSDTACFLIDAI